MTPHISVKSGVYSKVCSGSQQNKHQNSTLQAKWKHFSRYCPFVRGIHRSPVNSPHKGQWRGALIFSLICAWINGWVTNGEAGDLRRHRVHFFPQKEPVMRKAYPWYDVIIMIYSLFAFLQFKVISYWIRNVDWAQNRTSVLYRFSYFRKKAFWKY